jgi:hypothetical protein
MNYERFFEGTYLVIMYILPCLECESGLVLELCEGLKIKKNPFDKFGTLSWSQAGCPDEYVKKSPKM